MLKKLKGRLKSRKKEPSAHGNAPPSVLSSPSISQSGTPSPTRPQTPSDSTDPANRSPHAPHATSSIPSVHLLSAAVPIQRTPSTSHGSNKSHDTASRADGPSSRDSVSTVHESQRMLEGASHFKIENSVMMNVRGDATIFNFIDPDSASPSGLAESNDINATIKRSVALLKVLGVVLGAPAVDSFLGSINVGEGITEGRKVLEGHCGRLGELIKSLMEKEGGSIPLQLKNGLNELYRELAMVSKELNDEKDSSIVVEEATRKITEAVDMMITELTSHYIKDLPRVNAAYNDYTSQHKRRATCFEGTREALLKEVEDWVPEMQGSRFYLLSGVAGIGKSTVAQTVAQWAHKLRYLGASFFFSRDEKERRTAEKFFTSIAYQLCIHDEEFALLIGRALRTKEGMDATTKDPITQLDVLLLKPLRNVESRAQTTAIVVDALDECDEEDGPLVLIGMQKIVQELQFLKVILTTRPQPHLQPFLDNLRALKIVYLHDIDENVVDGDIMRYLEYCLSQEQVAKRLPLRQPWNASDEEVQSLVQGAGRLFIIASTAVLFILNKVARDPTSQMTLLRRAFEAGRTPFDSLNDFYAIILRSAIPVDCPYRFVQRYQAVVGTIVLIQNPLSIGTLSKLIRISADGIHAVLDNLQPVILLSASGDIPIVYHKSFPDYLLDAERCRDQSLHISPKDHHTRLATCCLHIMNGRLKHNILGLGGPARYFDNDNALEEEGQLENDLQQAIPAELKYAVIHWASHIKHADPEDNVLIEALKKFSEEHLLHWFEALSWIRKLGAAHISLDVVSKFPMPNSDMSEIFSDAFRFISRNYHRIEQSALYTYHSALPFTPTESLLYKRSSKEMLQNLCQVEGGPVHWDTLIAAPQHGTNYFRVMFSPNSSRLASWDDNAMNIWNSMTGTLVRAFDSSKAALANDFSIVALLQGSSVMVYKISSGTPTTSFNPAAAVVKLALSSDGSQLAAGLQNGTVSVWDVGDHNLIASLDGYDPATPDPWDSCQAFSPSGHMLIFKTSGGVNLWNGRVVTRMEHGSEEPAEILFLSDGTRLASLASHFGDYNLRLWNGENGAIIGVARDVGWTLAISADDSLFATGGWNKEVRLWRGDSLSLVGTIPIEGTRSLAFLGDILAIGFRSTVTLYDVESLASIATLQIHMPFSIAFSPDGTRLAAGSLNGAGILSGTGSLGGAMYLWDVEGVRTSPPTSGCQQTYVSALAFSRDCSRLACGFEDGGIELWDTTHSRSTVARHKLHSSLISVFAFSPDGKELASGAGELRLWDGIDGAPTGIIEHIFPRQPHSMALSGSLLAVAASDVITLWDHQSRHLIHTLSQNGDSLLLDGSMLFFAASNEDWAYRVTVWDTEARAPTTTIDTDSPVHDLFLSPDGSRIATRASGTLKLFDILNKKSIEDLECEDLSWIPHLDGIPISRTKDSERRDCLVGRFSARHDNVPVLWVERGFDVSRFAGQPSIFALGSARDRRILLVRPVYTKA